MLFAGLLCLLALALSDDIPPQQPGRRAQKPPLNPTPWRQAQTGECAGQGCDKYGIHGNKADTSKEEV
jgi:hypothetical protein